MGAHVQETKTLRNLWGVMRRPGQSCTHKHKALRANKLNFSACSAAPTLVAVVVGRFAVEEGWLGRCVACPRIKAPKLWTRAGPGLEWQQRSTHRSRNNDLILMGAEAERDAALVAWLVRAHLCHVT